MFRTLLRSLLATMAVVLALGTAPMEAFAKEATKTIASEAAPAKKMAWNRTVTLNQKTGVYHVKGCRHFEGKGSKKMTLKAAKAAEGKPCKVCIPKS